MVFTLGFHSFTVSARSIRSITVLAAWCSLFVLAGFFSWQFGPVSAGSERERARGVNSFHIFFDTIVMNFYIFFSMIIISMSTLSYIEL